MQVFFAEQGCLRAQMLSRLSLVTENKKTPTSHMK